MGKGNLEKLIVPGYGEDYLMNCPQCKGYKAVNIHLISIKVYRGTDATTINEKGIFVESIPNLSRGRRGARIEIEYNCEQEGHHGIIALQFHKGEVFIQHEELAKTAEGGLLNLLDDIWRD